MKRFCKRCKLMVDAIRTSIKTEDGDHRVEFKCPRCNRIILSYRTTVLNDS